MPQGTCLRLYLYPCRSAWHAEFDSESAKEILIKGFEMPKALKVAQTVFKVLNCELVWDARLKLSSDLLSKGLQLLN